MQEYEQMHILSPFVAPRDFYFLRYCHQIGEGEWMIVEVSYDIFHGSQERDCHSHSWRLPSGCIVRDLSNGCSMVRISLFNNVVTFANYIVEMEIIFRTITIHKLYL